MGHSHFINTSSQTGNISSELRLYFGSLSRFAAANVILDKLGFGMEMGWEGDGLHEGDG